MILSGGEVVYSTEVEQVLHELPVVLEAAVVPRPDERLGECVHAVVALHRGGTATADELIAFCRERLAHYKCPRTGLQEVGKFRPTANFPRSACLGFYVTRAQLIVLCHDR